MPKLVRLYIVNVAIGFALAAVFVALLLWFNVAGLGRLVMASDIGLVAVGMLVFFNGIVFGGVQFAISVMRMGGRDGQGGGGGRWTLTKGVIDPALLRVPVRAAAPRRRF